MKSKHISSASENTPQGTPIKLNQINKSKTGNASKSQQFLYMQDTRSLSQRLYQHEVVDAMYKNNLETLKITMTDKKKVSYIPSQLLKVQVGNDWYAMITDSGPPKLNQNNNQKINKNNQYYTVFTVHGAPGDHRQWAGLQQQMQRQVRWINFIIPGFDGLDERRGTYTGTADDLSKLIVLVLQSRKVPKIIYCGHSLGSIFGGYFINKYPQVISGYVNITGIVNQWYTGLLTFYRQSSVAYGFQRGPNHAAMMRLLNKNQYRQQHHHRFISDTRQLKFIDKVPFPQLTVTEMCAYVKLITSLPKGCSQFYQMNHRLKLLRVLIFGKNDPLHENHKTQEQIYSITRGRFSFNNHQGNLKLISLMKNQLQQTLKQIYNIDVDAQKIQQYFCFNFDDTGHNAHKRRPKQISKVLKIYVTTLIIIQKYQNLMKTKL